MGRPPKDVARRVVVPGFFLVLVLLGVAVHADFGISYDEPDYYRYGDMVTTDLASGTRHAEEFSNLRFYGPVVPVIHSWVRDAIRPQPAEAFPLAHLINYLIFVAGAAAFYALARRQLGSWQWALAATAALVLSPRVFSHAFVNPKDAPFMALFVINIWLLIWYLETRKPLLLPMLGIATALMIDIRVPGVAVVLLVALALGADAWFSTSNRRLRQFIAPLGIYVAVAGLLTVVMWPFLWPDPVGRFAGALAMMASFAQGPSTTAYMGRLVNVSDLPWHYLPVWIGITTPPAYLALAAVGLTSKLTRNPIKVFRDVSVERHWYLVAGWLLAPLGFAAATGANLYDEWRQVLFVYPALLLFAAAGGRLLYMRVSRYGVAPKIALAGALAAIGLTVAVKMVALHPYEALYFNALTGGGEGAEGRYELDYWGVSYPAGLRFLLDEAPRGTIRVHACSHPGVINSYLFAERMRLEYTEAADADFSVCAPRDERLGLSGDPEYLSEYPTIFTVTRDGATFLYVKDLRGSD